MFSVIFEVHPKHNQHDAYLGYAKMLRPELEQIEGFVDNTRYGSLTRDGWILSLSNWRDEKSVVRWRTSMRHHEVQELGRGDVMLDYHLRVGELVTDTHLAEGSVLREQRFDETEVGEGTTLTLISATAQKGEASLNAAERAEWLGLLPLHGYLSWDVFEAILTPGDFMLLVSWKDRPSAIEFEDSVRLPKDARLRTVRVVRDYGMFDRREAPQYYPDARRSSREE